MFGAGAFSGDPCVCTTGFDYNGFVTIKLGNVNTGTLLERSRTCMSIGFRPRGTLSDRQGEDFSD